MKRYKYISKETRIRFHINGNRTPTYTLQRREYFWWKEVSRYYSFYIMIEPEQETEEYILAQLLEYEEEERVKDLAKLKAGTPVWERIKS